MNVAAIARSECGRLAEIHAASFDKGWPAAELARLAAEPNVLALRAGNEAAKGFVLVRRAADEAEILTLAVDPPARRQGLARQLLAACEAHLESAGVARIYLEVSDRNPAAQALYVAAGYRPAGRRARYYSDGSDALVMEKTFAQ